MATAFRKWSDQGYGRDRATDIYQVINAVTAEDALGADGLPGFNTSHPENVKLKAEQPFARRPGFTVWEVLVNYSIPENGDEHAQPSNPLEEPIAVEWAQGVSAEDVDRDRDGNPLVNSAGDAFDPPAKRDVITWFLTLFRNEPFYDFDKAKNFSNRINSNVFTAIQPNKKKITFPIGTVKCLSILPTGRFFVTSSFVNVAYRLEMREQLPDPLEPTVEFSPFQIIRLDQGERGWYNAGTNSQSSARPGAILDANGKEVTRAVRLGGTGAPLNSQYKIRKGERGTATPITIGVPPGAQGTTFGHNGDDGASFLIYTNYLAEDFSKLGFGGDTTPPAGG